MLTKRATAYLMASLFSVAVNVSPAWSQAATENCDKQETFSDLSSKCTDENEYSVIDRTVTNSTTKNADSSDHDNGHGNDPDHDDSGNPGQGGGNHGTGNNGKGNGPGK